MVVESKVGSIMVAVGAVIEQAETGKILILHREKTSFRTNTWELLYGRLDQHEEVLEALRREVAEETGITELEVRKLLRVWHFYRGEKSPDTEIHGFTFHCVTHQQEIKLSPEHSEWRWVEVAEAQVLTSNPGILLDIDCFLKKDNVQGVLFSGVDHLPTAVVSQSI